MAGAAAADPRGRNLAGRRLGRYEVLTQLASGGMAAVYVARAQGVAGFERLVAIKVLHPHLAYEQDFITMFLDEARLAARIRHPNVVPTLDISDTEGEGYFLVMDYVEGDHLGALLQRAAKANKRLPAPVVSRIIGDALGGLSAAHQLTDERGEPLMLVHRDISPHNVLVGTDGIARITDFGVAKAEVRLSSTREGQFKGKLAYMAPEQAASGEADQRSDLFSMGIILWEALTGRRLFRGKNNAETLNKILEEPIPAPSEVRPDLSPFDPVLHTVLARERDERYQTAEQFADALEEAAKQSEGVASGRQVAEVVRAYASEKLQEERQRVRDAIDQLGRTDLGEAQMPLPREGSGSAVSRKDDRPVDRSRDVEAEADTLAARPSSQPPPGPQQPQAPSSPEPSAGPGASRRRGFLLVGALLAVGLALGAWLLLQDASGGPARPTAGTEPAPAAESPTDRTGAAREQQPTPQAAGSPRGDAAEPDPTRDQPSNAAAETEPSEPQAGARSAAAEPSGSKSPQPGAHRSPKASSPTAGQSSPEQPPVSRTPASAGTPAASGDEHDAVSAPADDETTGLIDNPYRR
jgi:serine/threonine-protein kinase